MCGGREGERAPAAPVYSSSEEAARFVVLPCRQVQAIGVDMCRM